MIGSAILIDTDKQSAGIELWLFDKPVTPQTDNMALTFVSTHSTRCFGVVPFSTYYTTTDSSFSPAPNLGYWFKTDTTATSIYGCLQSITTAAHTTSGLTVRLFPSQD